jgi:cytochrome P450
MINLDKLTKAVLHNISKGEEFDSLTILAEEMRRELRDQPIDEATEWTALKDALKREFKIKGIQQFLNQIKQIANEVNEEQQGK